MWSLGINADADLASGARILQVSRSGSMEYGNTDTNQLPEVCEPDAAGAIDSFSRDIAEEMYPTLFAGLEFELDLLDDSLANPPPPPPPPPGPRAIVKVPSEE